MRARSTPPVCYYTCTGSWARLSTTDDSCRRGPACNIRYLEPVERERAYPVDPRPARITTDHRRNGGHEVLHALLISCGRVRAAATRSDQCQALGHGHGSQKVIQNNPVSLGPEKLRRLKRTCGKTRNFAVLPTCGVPRPYSGCGGSGYWRGSQEAVLSPQATATRVT